MHLDLPLIRGLSDIEALLVTLSPRKSRVDQRLLLAVAAKGNRKQSHIHQVIEEGLGSRRRIDQAGDIAKGVAE